ncbi:MAG: LLM class flavin-dependent oxidoreductase [Acidimicrobiales bacterium]
MLLGISSFGTGMGPADTIALATQVEAAGFHRFMLVERVHTNDSVAQCAAIGAATERIGVGTGIANVYLRSPQMLGLATAVAAESSNGRFVLGLGPNNRNGVERLGLTWRGAVPSLVEATEAVHRVLAGTPGSVEPCRHPVPVVWAAVSLATAEAAGTHADGVMLYLATADRITTSLTRYDEASARAGRADGARERSLLLPVFLHADAGAARAAARRFLSFYLTLPHYQAMFEASGFAGAGPDNIADGLLDAIVLAGPAEHCRHGLARLAATGLTHVDLAPLPVGDETLPAAAQRVMESLAPA